MQRMRRRKGRCQKWPRALARPADACADPYRWATWHCRGTRGCSFGCVRAGLPRPFLRGVVDRRWHEPTRATARGAETGCASDRFENNSKSSATSLDFMPTPRSFGPSSTIQVCRISPGPGACTACPCSLRVLCNCLRVPCLHLCVCQPACVCRYRVPATACDACAGPFCANTLYWFARAFPVPACVLCLHLVDILNCSHDH